MEDTVSKHFEEQEDDNVFFCKECLSLAVKIEENYGFDYCSKCGSTDILEKPFKVWERFYIAKYDHPFTKKRH